MRVLARKEGRFPAVWRSLSLEYACIKARISRISGGFSLFLRSKALVKGKSKGFSLFFGQTFERNDKFFEIRGFTIDFRFHSFHKASESFFQYFFAVFRLHALILCVFYVKLTIFLLINEYFYYF